MSAVLFRNKLARATLGGCLMERGHILEGKVALVGRALERKSTDFTTGHRLDLSVYVYNYNAYTSKYIIFTQHFPSEHRSNCLWIGQCISLIKVCWIFYQVPFVHAFSRFWNFPECTCPHKQWAYRGWGGFCWNYLGQVRDICVRDLEVVFPWVLSWFCLCFYIFVQLAIGGRRSCKGASPSGFRANQMHKR